MQFQIEYFLQIVTIPFLLLTSSPIFATTHFVAMKSISYDPKVIEIRVGDFIQWTNQAYTEHSATSYENKTLIFKFDTGLIQPNKKSKKIEFQQVGNFNYHCLVHGKAMTGKISVVK